MATGKKITQYSDEVTSPSGTEIFDVSALISGSWKSARLTMSNLLAYISAQLADAWTTVTYSPSQDNWLTLGLSSAYRSIRVSYSIARGTTYQTGQFEVIHNGSNAKVSVIGKLNYSTAVDVEIKEARINVAALQVNIKTGSVDGNNTIMKYRICDYKPA